MENKKFRQLLGRFLIGLIGTVVIIISVFWDSEMFSFKNNNNEITAQKDFYTYINKEFIENHNLESDEEYWSLMITETSDKIDENVKEIIKDIVEEKEKYPTNSVEYKICQLYDSVINQKSDLSLISNYIEIIDSSNNINELMNNIVKTNNELSLGILINPLIQKDYKDNTKIIVNINPFCFDYGTIYSDYYTNPLYSSYTATYIEYDRKILKLYGYTDDEAKESIKKISKFYTEIANSSMKMEELAEVQNSYNIVTKEELKDIYNNINIDVFLKEYDKNYNISIVDIKQAKAINDYLIESNLETLKEYAKLQILQNCGIYASEEYYNLMNEFNARLSGTEITTDTVEDYAIELIRYYFDTEISKEYINRNINKDSTIYFENMINEIINQYKIRIEDNLWLTETTKQKALKKLDNMTVNVGYPQQWCVYANEYKLNDNLLKNIINMDKVIYDYQSQVIESNQDIWLMSVLDVNAYYNPQDNSINFPIALLECELYNEENSYYENLGSLGMVIAHEITHAFDNNGALFDEKGNMNDWWTEDDYNNFEKLQEDVINYYNEYKVNGKQTVGENIADLGAVSCIIDIAKSKGATQDELKQLFEAYASIWASKSTDEYARMLLMNDTHSPDKIRVNAVLSSIDEFYEVYNITEETEMYKNKNDRLKVW